MGYHLKFYREKSIGLMYDGHHKNGLGEGWP